jgi:hypothetical protein
MRIHEVSHEVAAFRKVCALMTFVRPARRTATLMALLITLGST